MSPNESSRGSPPLPPRRPVVAAVLISRNEEENIGPCIESVLRSLSSARAGGLVEEFEVVLVDSASTDRTVSIALRYPIRILRLNRSWPLSAAAGRYVGFKHTSAPVLLFLDGDEELLQGWLERALEHLSSPDVAAVAGHEIEASPGTSVIARKYRSAQRPDQLPKAIMLTDSMCSGLFKRDAVEQVGGIQPFLRAAEDRDLGTRLRAAGWQLLLMPEVMAKHRWSDARLFGYIDYFRSVAVWSLGEGQVFRHRFGNKALRSYYFSRYVDLRHAMNYALVLLVAAIGLTNLAALLSFPFLLVAVIVDSFTLLILESYRRSRKWSWRELVYEFHAIPYSLIRHAGFIRGLMISTPDSSRYPLNAEMVQANASYSG